MTRNHHARVLVVGDYYVDLVFAGLPRWPQPGEEIFATQALTLPGGAFTQARALHRLGVSAPWAAELGNDAYSRIVLDAAAAEGLDTSAYLVHDRPVRNVSVAASHAGERGFISFKEPLRPRAVAEVIADQHPTVVLLIELLSGQRLTELASAARGVGAQLVMDPQHLEVTLADDDIRAALGAVNVFMPNAAEARQLTGHSDLDEAVDQLTALTPTVVVKNGAEGAVAASGAVRVHAAAPAVSAVDTIGAGDCFDAGFVAGFVNGIDLGASLRLAVLCGSLSTLDYGGSAAPTLGELARHHPDLVPWAAEPPVSQSAEPA